MSQNATEFTTDNINITAELEKQAADMRLQLPKKMNETTTANNVIVDGTTIIYDMSLASDVDENQLSVQSLRNSLIEPLCLDKKSRALLDVGVIFEYDYTHSSSGNVYKAAITKYDC